MEPNTTVLPKTEKRSLVRARNRAEAIELYRLELNRRRFLVGVVGGALSVIPFWARPTPVSAASPILTATSQAYDGLMREWGFNDSGGNAQDLPADMPPDQQTEFAAMEEELARDGFSDWSHATVYGSNNGNIVTQVFQVLNLDGLNACFPRLDAGNVGTMFESVTVYGLSLAANEWKNSKGAGKGISSREGLMPKGNLQTNGKNRDTAMWGKPMLEPYFYETEAEGAVGFAYQPSRTGGNDLIRIVAVDDEGEEIFGKRYTLEVPR